MDLLTMVTNGMLFSFGVWASFIITLGLISIIIYAIGAVLYYIAER